MTRLEKKCVIASAGLHGLLLIAVVFGAAFGPNPRPNPQQRLNVVPTHVLDELLAGGGGNPALPRTDEQVKGETLRPEPPAPKPPVRQPEPRSPQPEPVRTPPKPVTTATKPPVKPVADAPKLTPVSKPAPALPLVPIVRNDAAKAKAKAEAEAREANRLENQRRREIASRIGQTANSLKAGFNSGTVVDVGGPGGAAYANYSSFVQAAYDNAWQVLPDLASQDHVCVVEVVIARTGQIISHRISSRSGNAVMDRSVQRALDRVKLDGLPPFPEGARDAERKFTIEFNLKARRLLG